MDLCFVAIIAIFLPFLQSGNCANTKSGRFSIIYLIKVDTFEPFADVVVILGGEIEQEFNSASFQVQTYSEKCGFFQSNLPNLPKALHSHGATFVNDK